VAQPGTKWEYGVNIDWAGELVMRVSGLSLDDYFEKHIFEPLGIKDIKMIPSADMKQRFSYFHLRGPDGKVSLREEGHIYQQPLIVQTPEEAKAIYQSGGGGCYAVPKEYCSIVSLICVFIGSTN
jgi:CubicO group peptidase (beta-lactamase class C family)